MAKYLTTGRGEGLKQAEVAFRQALDLNPDLAIAHKFYAQLEVDLGRAGDAMARLLPRAQGAADPEIFAALISPLRYCGLLEASAAAYARAVSLEPTIRTSIVHTWFLQRDYRRVASTRIRRQSLHCGVVACGDRTRQRSRRRAAGFGRVRSRRACETL